MNLQILMDLVGKTQEEFIIPLLDKNFPPMIEISCVTMIGHLPSCASLSTHVITRGKAHEEAYMAQIAKAKILTTKFLPKALEFNPTLADPTGIWRNIILKNNFQAITVAVATSDKQEAVTIMNFWIKAISQQI